jgi:molybdopterin synthase catalytic subunit
VIAVSAPHRRAALAACREGDLHALGNRAALEKEV